MKVKEVVGEIMEDITAADELKMVKKIDKIQKKILKLLVRENTEDGVVMFAFQNIIVMLLLANPDIDVGDALAAVEQMHKYSKMMIVKSAKDMGDQKT